MALARCNACGGIYVRVQADGTEYFHVCPPIVKLKVKRLDNSIVVIDPVALVASDLVLATRAILPPGARDENIALDGTGKAVVKAAGAGVTILEP